VVEGGIGRRKLFPDHRSLFRLFEAGSRVRALTLPSHMPRHIPFSSHFTSHCTPLTLTPFPQRATKSSPRPIHPSKLASSPQGYPVRHWARISLSDGSRVRAGGRKVCSYPDLIYFPISSLLSFLISFSSFFLFQLALSLRRINDSDSSGQAQNFW
jgi:hypothetical protein